MDLSTTYLGLRLPHPLMPGASPMDEDLDTVRRLEDAGAAAIVMHSLFEEQLVAEQVTAMNYLDSHEDTFAEALSYFPKVNDFRLGPDEYLEQLRKIKQAVAVPVIGSLNGTSPGGWLNFASLIEQAGADALELNVYYVATDPDEPARTLEERILEMVRSIKGKLRIPVAVKLSPFYTALAHFARELDRAGADGLLIFNRFYQADIDVEELQVQRSLRLSTSSALLLRIRWLAILSGIVRGSLGVTGGVHSGIDVIKAVMAGAHAVQTVSNLLRQGPDRLAELHREMLEWMEEHDYESLEQMRGSMSLERSPDTKAYERANYMEILQSWGR